MPIPGSLPGKRRNDTLSDPPPGKKKIRNIYWDPVTKEIVLDMED